MAECSQTLHRSANVMRRPVWARFAAIDHRSTDPREFQIAPFTLGFIVAHKSWSFLHANKTADVRNAAAGIIAAHQATRVADNFLLWRNFIATRRWRRHAIVIRENRTCCVASGLCLASSRGSQTALMVTTPQLNSCPWRLSRVDEIA